MNELRKCEISISPMEVKTGLFHMWAEVAYPVQNDSQTMQYKAIKAIVELDDGTVREVKPWAIRFL